MPRIEIDQARCKGCALCTVICPRNIVKLDDRINALGYHTACAPDQAQCTGCALCAEICPDVAIIVFR